MTLTGSGSSSRITAPRWVRLALRTRATTTSRAGAGLGVMRRVFMRRDIASSGDCRAVS